MKIIVFSFAILLFINQTNGRISYEHNEKASNYCGLVNCEYLKTDDSDYQTYIPIENLTNIESYDGYILRFPFLVIGSRNAHVVFTNTESPDWDVDKGYEFVFGGWRNSRHAIRNRNGFKEFTYSRSENVISNEHPTRFLIEIAGSGYIRVFINNNSEPFISTFDPNPLPVKYVSFRSHEDYDLEYFYNCPSLKDDILPPSTEAPLTEDGDLSTAPLDVLTTVCKWYDAWKGDDSSYYKIEDSFIDSRSGINKTTLEFYIVYISTARIVLTTGETTRGDNYYEFTLDNSNNAKLVRRYGYYDSETQGSFRLPVYPSNSGPLKITIEISSNGLIEIYVGPGSYKSSLSVNVNSNLDINYVSFSTGGDTRTLYYFGCPIRNVTTGHYDVLPAEDFNIYGSLDQNCSQFNTEEYIFSEYIPLSELSTDVQPDGYLIRLPFYVKASSDVHILFTSQLESKDRQFYQFVIDGLLNSYSSVSKNRDVLAKSNERNILDYYRAVRIVLEITNDGVIRIFTEYNKMKPLLEVHDPNPITNLKYLAFDGINRRNLFYYDCAKFKPEEVEAVTENAMIENATSEDATIELATNETATFENVTTEHATTEHTTSENVTTENATTEHATSENVTTENATTEHTTSENVSTENATTEKSSDKVVEQSFVSNGTDVQIDIRHNEILTSDATTVI